MLSLVASTNWNSAGIRRGPLPHPQQLSALGAVLCSYRRRSGSELVGWDRAVRVEARSDNAPGMPECLMFFDQSDRCCWRLYLLPDTDFLAWDALVSELPTAPARSSKGPARWWGKLYDTWHDGSWSNCIVRLHDHSAMAGHRTLAASLSRISLLGMKTAGQILRSERLGAVDAAESVGGRLTPGQA